MAPNKRGGPPSFAISNGKPVAADSAADICSGGAHQGVISKDEVAARGSGTEEHGDTYGTMPRPWNEVRVFFTGLMFLTRLPCPRWIDHHPAFLMRSIAYFPIFGALIGGWAAAFYAAAQPLWGAGPAAAISTLATVWLTGCFHEDGMADCFDGFGGGWGRAQILRIMKDSRIGTYALVGTSLVLWLKLQALAALPPHVAPWALVAGHCASRWTSMPLIYCCTYVQDEDDAKKGLYNWFAQSKRLLSPLRLLLGTAAALLLPAAALGLPRAALLAAVVAATAACAGPYATAVIGGVVGDYLGATIQIAELCCYLALAADWSALAAWDAPGMRPLVVLAGVAALPVAYSRRIVDFGAPRC